MFSSAPTVTTPPSPSTTRRDFIRFSARGAGVMALAGCMPGWMINRLRAADSPKDADRRALVLVQLAGGNDGLNTLVPYTDARYYRLRPTLSVNPREVRPLNQHLGLHPACGPLHDLFSTGQLAIVQNVGYAHSSRSHFQSAQIWATGDKHFGHGSRGWISRWLDETTSSAAPAARYFDRTLPAVLRGGESQSKAEAPRGTFAQTLRHISDLIDSKQGPRICHVTLAGFDTHRHQAPQHQQLLHTLSAGLHAFQSDLQSRGLADRVLTMTYSEFGRTVAENDGQGTDHGTTAPLFLMGTRVHGGLHGPAPELDPPQAHAPENLTDFRSVYASILEDWMQCPALRVLGQPVGKLSLVG